MQHVPILHDVVFAFEAQDALRRALASESASKRSVTGRQNVLPRMSASWLLRGRLVFE